MNRTATAVWTGDLKQGRGVLSTAGGALKETPYSFTSRFESGAGTNPEELIAAAHAGCFAMALSAELAKAGHTAERLQAKATVSLEQVAGAWTIATSHIDLDARVPGIDRGAFETIANGAKANCPVSKVLNAKITLTAKLA